MKNLYILLTIFTAISNLFVNLFLGYMDYDYAIFFLIVISYSILIITYYILRKYRIFVLMLVIPRYFTSVVGCIVVSLHLTVNPSLFFILCFVPQIIASVFPRCSDSRLSINHSLHVFFISILFPFLLRPLFHIFNQLCHAFLFFVLPIPPLCARLRPPSAVLPSSSPSIPPFLLYFSSLLFFLLF